MTLSKARIATITIGDKDIEVVLKPDGTFWITMSQLARLVNYDANHISRKLTSKQAQSLVPQGFQNSHYKVEGYNNTAKLVSIEDLSGVLLVLAMSGLNEAAILLGALSGLALYQLCCDSFGIMLDKEDRAKYLQARMAGIKVRRTCTGALQDWLAKYAKNLTQEQLGQKYAEMTDVSTWGYLVERLSNSKNSVIAKSYEMQ